MKRDSRKTKTRAAKQEGPERMAAPHFSPPEVERHPACTSDPSVAAEKPFPKEVFVQHDYWGTRLVVAETGEQMLSGSVHGDVADKSCKRVGRYKLISEVMLSVMPITTLGLIVPVPDASVGCASSDVHVVEVTRATDRKFRAAVRGDRKRKAGGKRKPRAERRGRR
jgi:hypothetical protein